MKIYFKASDSYHPGFQKFNILKDRTFRRCLAVFCGLILMVAPISLAFPPGMKREIGFIFVFLVYMLPAAISLAGGMPRAGWARYALAAAVYAVGTIPFALGAPPVLLLFIPLSVALLVAALRTAPRVAVALGYGRPASIPVVVVFTVILAAVFISYTWLGQILIRKNGFQTYTIAQYLWMFATAALYYGTLWGVLTGLILRRFLDMRYELVFPVVLNAIILSLYWLPSAITYSVKPDLAVGGSILQALASQATIGMAFYFNKSTWGPMLAYTSYYLFLKSVNF